MSAPDKPQGTAQPSVVDTDPDTLLIKQEIEKTRASMSKTIAALEARLKPADLRQQLGVELQHVEERVRVVVREQMDDAEAKVKRGLFDAKESVKADLQQAFDGAKQSVRAATLGKVEDLATDIGDTMNDTRDTLVDTIRQNPIPVALVGVGLVWLLMNRSNKTKRSRALEAHQYGPPDGHQTSVGHASNGAGHVLHDVQHAARNVVGDMSAGVGHASATVRDVARQATGAASNALHDASEFAGHALHGASDLAGQAGGAVTDAVRAGRQGAHRAEQGFQTTLQENPLALGAAALALGAVVGFTLPRTRGEDALMGEARDRVLHRAGEAAQEAATSVSHFTEQALESAKKNLQDSVANAVK